MHHYLYKTENLITSQYYIGCRSTRIRAELDTDYLGSGYRLQQSIKKYGAENFKKEVLFLCKDAATKYYLESIIVNEALLQDPLCMNLKTGGMGGNHSEETRQKISESHMGKTHSEETRRNRTIT
jgi:hypothetical protein